MATYKWEFASRFRSRAFGWRSDLPIKRIKEALSEIKQVARKEPVLAAEGAVLFLGKLSAALEQVDSSSGAIGSTVSAAIATLVPIIARADVDSSKRQQWLDRLWQAIQDDTMPYLDSLGSYWGELCVTPFLASRWADQLQHVVELVWSPETGSYGCFSGTVICLASLFKAGRHDDLLALLEKAPRKWWYDREWGVKALAAQGKTDEAIRYAEDTQGINEPYRLIALACEEILLAAGRHSEAYERYALDANQSTTNLATFRTIVKKYPHKPPADILSDLIASTPYDAGKWFAAAKSAGQFEVAMKLVQDSPTDPRTLVRAARDHATQRPDFALACGMAALRWIASGFGYDISGGDVLGAWDAIQQAAVAGKMDRQQVHAQVLAICDTPQPGSDFIKSLLARQLQEYCQL
jgi:tetratricopeptide (TPR) repeat protein